MGCGAAEATGWALFVLLLSTLVCCQPTEFILVFSFHKFFNFTPPLPPRHPGPDQSWRRHGGVGPWPQRRACLLHRVPGGKSRLARWGGGVVWKKPNILHFSIFPPSGFTILIHYVLTLQRNKLAISTTITSYSTVLVSWELATWGLKYRDILKIWDCGVSIMSWRRRISVSV